MFQNVSSEIIFGQFFSGHTAGRYEKKIRKLMYFQKLVITIEADYILWNKLILLFES